MNPSLTNTMNLDSGDIDYRVIHSKTAKKLRVRVTTGGVEVVQPGERLDSERDAFLEANQDWIAIQLERMEQLRSIRKPAKIETGSILFRGNSTPVHIEDIARRKGTNKVNFEDDVITITRGQQSLTAPVQSLENWLRKQARQAITTELEILTQKLNRTPNQIYIMGQRTKWGNCSAKQNLSFNWRLIMAPDYVLRYLVTHEAVHLAVPDHSKRFWLTVQSHCPEMESAKQWLVVNGDELMKGVAVAE